MRIGLYANSEKAGSRELLDYLFNLQDDTFEFIIDKDLDSYFDNEKYVFGDLLLSDIILILGGDGTLLKCARCFTYNIPLLGVNFGHLGFLAEVTKEGIDAALDKIKNKDYYIEDRMMLKAQVFKDNKLIFDQIALNDVVLTRKSTSRIISTKVKVNDLLLDTYYADGVIVSTPTGSTGYNLSAGGPILDPEVNIILITPVSPHSLHSRSVAVCDNKTVQLAPDLDYNENTILTVDGQIDIDISGDMKIIITKAENTTKLLKLRNFSFYELLREKLFIRGQK